MQVPTRRADKAPPAKSDFHVTPEKLAEMEKELYRLLHLVRPKVIEEVKRLSLTGDYSENAGYQMAKGKLRGINRRILELETMIKYAEVIHSEMAGDYIALGDIITLEKDGRKQTYRLLGSAESNPAAGIISHNSPLGALLLGKKIGETVRLKLADKIAEYKITEIK